MKAKPEKFKGIFSEEVPVKAEKKQKPQQMWMTAVWAVIAVACIAGLVFLLPNLLGMHSNPGGLSMGPSEFQRGNFTGEFRGGNFSRFQRNEFGIQQFTRGWTGYLLAAVLVVIALFSLYKVYKGLKK